jgi:HK97 family phage prohead protease
VRLDLSQPIHLDVEAAEGDEPRRLISGVAVPYGENANASTGPVRFEKGALATDGPAPKLIRDHNLSHPIGIVLSRTDTDDGMLFVARISETEAGDEALTLAADGVLDSVSVGVEVQDFGYDGDVMVVKAARWRELSLVPFGAFEAAKIHQVAATEAAEDAVTESTPTDPEEDPTMEDQTTEVEAAPAVEAQTQPLTFTASASLPSAGEYVAAMLKGNPIKIQAATGDTADVPGLIPNPLVGEIFDTLTGVRPIFSALGPRAMPAGDPFYARKVTQHTAVGVQAAEHDTLSSQAYTVAKVQVDKVTFGGYLDLSEQEILYSDANAIQLVIDDMSRVYGEQTERWVGDSVLFSNASAATQQVTSWTDGDEVVTDLYAAAAEIYANFGRMPTHLIVKSSVWAQIGAAKDSGGNRIFPYLSPSNAAGTLNGATALSGNPLGLQLIVSDDWDLTAGTSNAMMLSATALNIFEDNRGALRVEQPASLSTRLAFRGYVAAANYDISNGCLIV